MPNQDELPVNVDLVLCIDATGSMKPIIDKVKTNALTFHEQLTSALAEKKRTMSQLRVKVIVFRDESMNISRFFNLPQENDDFKSFVSGIEAKGGGDEPENALEALALAMNSDWVKEGVKKRHVITIWTDASAHPLEKRETDGTPSNYPSDMPASLMELSDMWLDPQMGAMNSNAKRLAIFAPDAYPWSDLATSWDVTFHIPSKAGEGMDDFEMGEVITTLANSI